MNLLLRLISLLILSLLFSFCTSTEDNQIRFTPSNNQAYLPKDNLVDFSTYVQENRYRIKKSIEPIYLSAKTKKEKVFLGLPIDEVVNLRSPEEIIPQNCKSSKKGFLLIHGLFDSPYSLKDIQGSLKEKYPCAIFRSILLTGHGTIPGDANKVNFEEWVELLEYGLSKFVGEVDQLYLVGYSTGFTLSLLRIQQKGDLIKHHDQQLKIQGLIGVSPALVPAGPAFIAPFLSLFINHLNIYLDEDPVKYESLNLNLVAQFYHLSKKIDLNKIITTPVFMVNSSDDQTVDPMENYKYFCQRVDGIKKMVWYQGFDNKVSPCEGISIETSASKTYETVNMSHIGIPFKPDNPIYGYKKKYANCLSFFKEDISFTECKSNKSPTIYGEENILKNIDVLQGKYFRRVSFNPFYNKLVESIDGFIKETSKNKK